MSKAPELTETFLPPDEIVQAGLNGDLILFVGAGASMLLGLPSWSGLASKVLEDLRQAGHLNYSELEQLQTLDAKKQLSIAQLIAKDKKYDLKMQRFLSGISEGDSIYKALNDIGCSCVTTNYDELLSPRYTETKDGSSTPVPVNRVSEPDKFFAHLLNEPGTVVHLHGSI
ncbi:MAG: SIR2 family protein, partial [Sulfuricella sp.]